MLRKFFPSTEVGAELYGGFLSHKDCFCKIFDMKSSIDEALVEINNFLELNGYETADANSFDEFNIYKCDPVRISPHGYQDQFVLFIDRDKVAKTQLGFVCNELKKFRDERDWEQFHNPKDLAIALNIETGELLETFLWKDSKEANIDKIKEELADVFSYALLLADKYNLDIEEIILNKISSNNKKYPVEKAKGSAKKYDEL